MRNAEVIRQWTILRDLESSRRLTIDDLAEKTGVSTRTIRRDLEALQASGFPLYDDLHEGKRYWMLEQRPFRRLDETGFTLAELSALYFSRTLVEALASTPFHQDLRNAFDKLSAALTPGMSSNIPCQYHSPPRCNQKMGNSSCSLSRHAQSASVHSSRVR